MKEKLTASKLSDAATVQSTLESELKAANVEVKDKDLEGILGTASEEKEAKKEEAK